MTKAERQAITDKLYFKLIKAATKFAQSKNLYDQSYYHGQAHAFYDAICDFAMGWYGVMGKDYTELRDELRAVLGMES